MRASNSESDSVAASAVSDGALSCRSDVVNVNLYSLVAVSPAIQDSRRIRLDTSTPSLPAHPSGGGIVIR
jgi:hypothetical protein